MKKSDVFRKIVKLNKESTEFLDSIPVEINEAFFDNPHSNAIGMINDLLIKAYFQEHAESIFWFLYEWKPFAEVEYCGVTEKIKDIDHYIDWMQRVEGFGE